MSIDNEIPKICCYCLEEIDDSNCIPEDEIVRIEEKVFSSDGDVTEKEAYALSGLCIECYEAMNDRGKI